MFLFPQKFSIKYIHSSGAAFLSQLFTEINPVSQRIHSELHNDSL